MKLDIQRFSGGSYDYSYNYLGIYLNSCYDEELNLMIGDLQEVLHDLEWWQSNDSSEETYRKTLNDFKNKWFGKRDERLKELVKTKCEELEKHLLYVIGE